MVAPIWYWGYDSWADTTAPALVGSPRGIIQGRVLSVVVVQVAVVVVAVLVVVGQLPSSHSRFSVMAPEMQVPSAVAVVSALLQPQEPVQSLPHT